MPDVGRVVGGTLSRYDNNNNKSGFLYSAQVHHAVALMTVQHYYPWSLGLNSFLKPSQLPVEYTACAAKHVAQSRLINHKNQMPSHEYISHDLLCVPNAMFVSYVACHAERSSTLDPISCV